MIKEQLQIHYPKDPLLQQYIAYYYFLNTTADFYSHYFSFPNTITSFNIHKNVNARITAQRITVSHDLANQYLAILQGKYKQPLEVELSGRMDKVTIGFKPLGLGHFMDRHYGDVATNTSQIFTEWDGECNYHNMLDAFFGTDDLNSRVDVLEKYLLQIYRPVPADNLLEEALTLLTDERNFSTLAIAEQLNQSERTFNRLFRKHMGLSPNVYRIISRFRKSMEVKLFSENFISLTEACYRSGFYDQAYFNKLYQKATGSNPRSFFREVASFADNNLIFKITE